MTFVEAEHTPILSPLSSKVGGLIAYADFSGNVSMKKIVNADLLPQEDVTYLKNELKSRVKIIEGDVSNILFLY